ncbi:sugar transferase [Paenibacillus sp. DMB20]|uniref:sugar transferase n=1 Tax=Paenibacillus sp. DMB20 TaxID=1642570 RepID=UPI0006279B8E|nr:sugar transferase [Paenibacillus sp. DMB20]KKO51003.1 multidrug MFS transporter [Paenibacillus sp. DMB20]
MAVKLMETVPMADREPGEVSASPFVFPTLDRKHPRGKRLLDLSVSICLLILFIPLFTVIYVLIKWENPHGAVFFSQLRVGERGRVFKMYKFRSMVPHAESLKEDILHLNEVSGAMFKMKNDPRVTKIGRFLRKCSLDELPQLWNVMKGDMSLVGPRPPLPEEVAQYSLYDLQRLSVTPGCTGLWQVSGRNNVGFRDMVELDLQYIRKQSLLLDICILFKTVKVMMGSKDAF